MRHGGDTRLGCDRQTAAAALHYRGTEGSPPLPLVDLSWKTVRTGLAEKRIFHIGSAMKRSDPAAKNDPIAQLDRVADFYSAGCRFESCWDRQ